MGLLIIDQPGVQIGRRDDLLVVQRRDDDGRLAAPLLTVRLQELTGLVLANHAAISTAALAACLAHGVEVALLSPGGELLGRMVSAAYGPRADLRRRQWILSEMPGGCSDVARLLVEGKLAGIARRMERWARDHGPAVAERLQRVRDHRAAIWGTEEVDAIRGHEGNATRAYFGAVAALLAPRWTFTGRHRHPATDPVNSTLGFCYALLENLVASAVAGTGLDARIGFLHSVTGYRDSLVLDLMEEWRPLLADTVALSLLNRLQLRPEHFALPRQNGAVWLTPEGRQIVYTAWAEKLASEPTLRSGSSRSWRQLVCDQTEAFARAIPAVAAGEMDRAKEIYQPIAESLR